MTQEIEIEFKNIITRQTFDLLCRHFDINRDDFALQDNHYFDTPDLMLKEKGCALRIRHKNNSFTLTLKQPHPDGLLETHQPLTDEEAETAGADGGFPGGEVTTILQAMDLPLPSLKNLGKLTTYRTEISYENGTLVLDHSEYSGIEDYELEYEVTSRISGEKVFNHLLESFSIPRRPSKNKVQRFFDYKENLPIDKPLGEDRG